MYQDSDSEEETPLQQNEVLRTSYNFADYVRSRESDYPERRSISHSYATRHILTHDMFRETPITLGNVNKVFCAQWLGSSQVSESISFPANHSSFPFVVAIRWSSEPSAIN